MIYNNTEFYVQDNWKVNNRLTLDYGMRFTHQQPQYDQFNQTSNFFPDMWSSSNAPVLYVAGCTSGATVCSGTDRNAMDPRNGQIVLPPAGAANTSVLIGTPIPNVGNPYEGIRQAGDGISKYSYTWPAIVFGPRFGAAYDVSGDQKLILRGGFGLFYDRPDGNTVFSIPNNPPITNSADLRNGTLATLGKGLAPQGVPGMVDLPVRRRRSGFVAVERWPSDGAPVVVVHRRVLRRQPRRQSPRRTPERQPRQPELG